MDLNDNPNLIQEELAIHEWIAIIAILGFLAMLTTLSITMSPEKIDVETSSAHYIKTQEYEVLIQGAVKKKGSYKVKVGTTLKEAIEIAIPDEDADLSQIRSTTKVKSGQIIEVPKKKMIEIELSGAVHEVGRIVVPHGTRMAELSNFVRYLPEADIEKLQKKRVLRSGDKIDVPSKIKKNKEESQPNF